MKTYKVITGRRGKWWWIEVPDVDMGFSQARTLREVPSMAVDVISALLDVPADSFAVKVTVNGEEAELARLVESTSAAAEEATRAAMAQKREAVLALVAKEMPVRDIAELLHLAPSYIHQISKRAAA